MYPPHLLVAEPTDDVEDGFVQVSGDPVAREDEESDDDSFIFIGGQPVETTHSDE